MPFEHLGARLFRSMLSTAFAPRIQDVLPPDAMEWMAPRVHRFNGRLMLIGGVLFGVLAPAMVLGVKWLNRAYPIPARGAVYDSRGPDLVKECLLLSAIPVMFILQLVVPPLWWRRDLRLYRRFESTRLDGRCGRVQVFMLAFLTMLGMVIGRLSWDFGVRVDENGIVPADSLMSVPRYRFADVREIKRISLRAPFTGIPGVERLHVRFAAGPPFQMSADEDLSAAQLDDVAAFVSAHARVAILNEPALR